MENKINFAEDVSLESVGFNDTEIIHPSQSNVISTRTLNNAEILNKLFVGGLNYATTEENFKSYFEKFGLLTDFVIIKDSLTKKSRGFGFVTFSSLIEVDKVMKSRPHFIEGRKLDLKRISPKNDSNKHINEMKITKLFIPKVDESIDENDLRTYFNSFGTILDVRIISNAAHSKRFAFITFDDYDTVDKIVSLKHHEIKQVKIIADKSKPKLSNTLHENGNKFPPLKNSKFIPSYNKNPRISTNPKQISTYYPNNNKNNQNFNLSQVYGSYHQTNSSHSNPGALMNQIYSNKSNSNTNLCGYGPLRKSNNMGLKRFAPY